MLSNFSVAFRLTLSFLLMGFIVLLLGLLAFNSLSQLRVAGKEIEDHSLPAIQLVGEMNQSFMFIRYLTLRTTLADDNQQIRGYAERIQQTREEMLAAERRFAALPINVAERRVFENLQAETGRYIQAQQTLIEILLAGRRDTAIQHIDDVLIPRASSITQLLGEIVTLNNADAAKAARTSAQTYQLARSVIIAAVVIAALLTALFAWVLSHSILRPVVVVQ